MAIIIKLCSKPSKIRMTLTLTALILIQRQFEDQDDNQCYIEMHDKKYCGHFLLRRMDFTPQKLSIELDRPRDNLLSVTFAMAATEFAEASQVVKIISGEIEPPDARNA